MHARTRNDACTSVPQATGSPGTGGGMLVSQSGNCEAQDQSIEVGGIDAELLLRGAHHLIILAGRRIIPLAVAAQALTEVKLDRVLTASVGVDAVGLARREVDEFDGAPVQPDEASFATSVLEADPASICTYPPVSWKKAEAQAGGAYTGHSLPPSSCPL